MKKLCIFAVALVVAAACLFLMPTEANAATEESLIYEVLYENGRGVAIISGYDTTLSGDVVIPSYLGGWPVMGIATSAFNGCTKLTSITIPSSVSYIGYTVFGGCKNLTSVSFAGNSLLTRIPDGTFHSCSNLTTIDIPDGVTRIDENAFYGCKSLKTITIPDGVTSIGSSAFENCTGLVSIKFPNNVTSIGEAAFRFCYALTSVEFSTYSKLADIANYAFYGCSNLANVSFGAYSPIINLGYRAFYGCKKLTYNLYSGAKYLGSGNNAYMVLMEVDSTSATSYEIHPDTKIIANFAFADCAELTDITIPDGVTSICYCAFDSCSNLTSIVIPDSVTNIGGRVLLYCNNLTDVYYTGTQAEWSKIEIGSDNSTLLSAKRHYKYHGPHTYGRLEKSPTCVLSGYIGYMCSICGDSYISEEIPALGHKEIIDEAVVPTCTATGLTEGKHCSACGVVTVAQKVLPMLEHAYSYANITEETHDAVCSVCGESRTEAHVYESDKCICGAEKPESEPTDANLKFYTNALDLKAAISAQFIPNPAAIKDYERIYISVTTGGGEPVIYESQLMNGIKYFQFGVIACEMDVEYDVTLYGEKGGVAYKGLTIGNWSVKNKAIDMLKNNIGDYKNTAKPLAKKDCDLAANLLSFGAEAQKRFLGKSDPELVTYGLDSQYAALIKKESQFLEAMPTFNDKKTVKIQTSALNMKDRIELFMMFKGVSDFTGYYAKIVCNDVITRIPLTLFTSNGTVYKNYGYFEFSGLTAGQLRDDMQITVYNSSRQAVSITYTYSVENKASTMQTEIDNALVTAMMHYSDAARARFS